MKQPNFAYYNAVDQIFHAEWSIPKLARQQLLRESVQTLWPEGHPTKLVHIAGTGGKGSTCRFLEMGFTSLGTAGAYMSPHLFDYRERFSVNGEFASQEDVLEAWETRVKPHNIRLAVDNPHMVHSVLESTILIALCIFEKHHAQWAAIETHLGGRYDPTRALDMEATLLTNVGSDHAHILGSEPWVRTLDKAGIARANVPFFTTERNPQLLEIIRSLCATTGAPLHIVDEAEVAAFGERIGALDDTEPADEEGAERGAEQALLHASYQRANASLAFAAIRHLCPQIDERDVLQRLRSAQLVGRLWQVEPRIYADIAHNAEKIDALANELQAKFGDVGKIFVVGISKKRVPLDVFARIAPLARAIIVTSASFKGQSPDQVQRDIQSLVPDTPTLTIAEPRQAFAVAKTMRTADEVILLTGSTYMIEQVLNPDPYASFLNANFGWRVNTKSEAQGTVNLTLPSTFELR